jgi:hypothetical protein
MASATAFEGRATVVVPTIREAGMRGFLEAWQSRLGDAHLIVVEDNPQRSFNLGTRANVTHYAWEEIDRDLGALAWIVPRRTDCVRSYGLWKAWQEDPDMVVTLDDDCHPDPAQGDFLAQHWARLQGSGRDEAWVSTGEGIAPRGMPYFARHRERPCMLNHGLWSGCPDFDAPTQLLQARAPGEFVPVDQTIPAGKYFPMCGMNIAFRPALAPAMYFLLMGQAQPVDRFGDIWCGLLAKKICDHLGYAVTSGRPSIAHQRASNVWDNLRKEAHGLRLNEEVWLAVDRVVLTGTTVVDCYAELAASLQLEGPYWAKVREAMQAWSGLFRGPRPRARRAERRTLESMEQTGE